MRPNAVALGQTLIVLLFVAEYLDDLLAVDHFFYIAIEVGQRLLLRHEIAADLHRELFDGQHDQEQRQAHHDGQTDAGIEHAEEYGDNGEGGGDELSHRLCDELAQRIGIVGI